MCIRDRHFGDSVLLREGTAGPLWLDMNLSLIHILMAIVARRFGIPVYHMEAGNRCYDFRVPEESNRRIIDHLSSVLMPYTNRSRENLLREGIAGQDIFVVGNPIYERCV